MPLVWACSARSCACVVMRVSVLRVFIMRVAVMPIAMRLRPVSALVDPAADVGGLAPRIEQGGAEQGVGRNLAVRHDMARRAGIEREQQPVQLRNRIGSGEVGLGHQQTVGEGRLLDCFRVLADLLRAVNGIDGGDHGVEPQIMADQRIIQQELYDRRRIGEPGGLHQHARKGRHLAAVALDQEVAQRLFQIAPQGAADAAARQNRDLAVDRLDQQMVEPDLAEFVDDDGAVPHAGVTQQLVEKRGLAAAEEARDQRNRESRSGLIGIEQSHACLPLLEGHAEILALAACVCVLFPSSGHITMIFATNDNQPARH